MPTQPLSCTAFAGSRRLASGTLLEVAVAVREAVDGGESASVLVFDDATAAAVELDLRGSAADVKRRIGAGAAPASQSEGDAVRAPGRPRLGVVGREVTLLPRHWDWLNSQPGGASVALRKLVDQARKANAGKDRVRRAQEVAYRFLSALAGNEEGYEEATRALFAGNGSRFAEMAAKWPADVREYALRLAGPAFDAE